MIKLIYIYFFFYLIYQNPKNFHYFSYFQKRVSSPKKFSISPAKKELNLFAPPTQPCFPLRIKNYYNRIITILHSKIIRQNSKNFFYFSLTPSSPKNSTFLHYQRNPPCFSEKWKIHRNRPMFRTRQINLTVEN